MAQQQKLSVITVCFNEKEIERTCRSIAGQSCQDFEWIVIDGGSTDGTLEILKRYQKRIDKLVSEPDNGIFDAMNKGIRLACGEWLIFMNGGDLFADEFVIGKFFAEEARFLDAGVVYGDYYRIYGDGRREYAAVDVKELDKLFFYNNCICHQASFIRRKLFEKYGVYDDKHRIVSDWEKWIVFAEHKVVFRHINFAVADFYYTGISSQMTPRHADERAEVIAAHFSKDEIAESQRRQFCRRYVKFFNLLPLLVFKRKKSGSRLEVLLFGFLPLYKITDKRGTIRHYLFGVLPWLTVKEED